MSTNAFQLKRSHGPHPGRFLHLATGDGILALDVQAAAEAIAVADGANAVEAAERASAVSVESVKRPADAAAFYARLRALSNWEACPHGYPTVVSLSASGPQRVGPFLVRAPWHPAAADALDILIEPGLSFGLGTHATTRLPLRHLTQHVRPRMRVADVGTGSGVLAIAMARLGAVDIEAVDRDPTAVAEARDNLARNGVRADVHPGSADSLHGTFDLITANMGGAPSVIEIAPHVAARLAPGGLFLASGIYGDTDDDAARVADGVADALAPLGLSEIGRETEHLCVGMVFRRVP